MKPILRLPAFLLGLCVATALQAQEIKLHLPDTGSPAAAQPAQPEPAKPAAQQFTEDQLLEMFGWYVGRQMGLAELGFTEAQTDAVTRGLKLSASGQEAPYSKEQIDPQLQAFMQGKQQEYMAKLKQKSLAETTLFFDKLKEDKDVVELPDGLRYKIIQPGAGDFPKPTQLVKVNYSGRLLNGTVFDASEKHGGPAEFVLGKVIPGWAEGVQKINKGGKIRLYIPPELAYGDQPPRGSGILPGSTLIFDIELLDIKEAPAAAAPTDTPQQ
jgi:FKBP-type peptidyl-prolyl cis-trans isomerase